MRKSIKAAVVVLAIGLFLVGCKEEAKGKDVDARGTEQCKGNILVHMGEFDLSVPRDGPMIKLEDNKIISFLNKPQPDYPCDKEEIHGAKGILWGHFEVFIPSDQSAPKDKKGMYGEFEERIKTAREKNKIEKLNDGIEMVDDEEWWNIFILPEDRAPTSSNYPVVLRCHPVSKEKNYPGSTDSCHTSYLSPTGLYLIYDFRMKDYTPEKYLEADAQQRRRLQSYLDDAKNTSLNLQK